MRTKIAQWIVAGLLVVAVGGHWAILQSVAWVGMAVKYSQTSTFRQALGKTFDGQHPCGICKVVEQGKKSENKPVSLKVETKLDFCPPLAPSLLVLEPLLPLVVPPAESDWALARFESPPTPPPRLA